MLPAFVTLTDQFDRATTRYMRDATKHHGIAVSKIGRSRIFEGQKNVIVRPTGERDETKMIEESVELRIPGEEARNLSLDGLLERLGGVAKEMAGRQERHLFATISETLAGKPNTVDAKGEKFSPELFYRMIEKIQIDFRPDGTPIMPTMYISPAQAKDVKAATIQADADPAFGKRFDEMMAKKREEWRAREASRQLVG